MPETSWSYHYWQPAQDGDRTDTQWKAKGREGTKLETAPLIMLLLPATLINKRYSPEHEEFHACASILIPLTN